MISQEINTFISLWQEDKNNNINVVIKKGNSVLKVSGPPSLCLLSSG